MNWVDWVLIAGLAAALAAAVWGVLRRKKKGTTCCGDCGSCGGCHKRQQEGL